MFKKNRIKFLKAFSHFSPFFFPLYLQLWFPEKNFGFFFSFLGTISYDPPKISVQEDNLLSVNINRGLILAECFPKNGSDPAILFKAEFTNLAGSGMIKLASTLDQTGIRASLDQLDLSRMNTKPFEPKLPLPEAFESQLMKSAIAQLQPIVNKYLTEKPLFLPDHVAPLAASPVLHLWSIGKTHYSKH